MGGEPGTAEFGHYEWHWDISFALPVNIFFSAAILIATGYISEWLIRRQRARAGVDPAAP